MGLRSVPVVVLAGVAAGLLSACGPAGESIGIGPPQDAITAVAIESVSGEVAAGVKKLLIQRVSGNYGKQAVQVYDPISHQSTIAWSAADSMTSWVEWWLPAIRNGVMGVVPYAATKSASVFVAP